eukprot:9397231-Alexandrium_andersonii.AAC.1
MGGRPASGRTSRSSRSIGWPSSCGSSRRARPGQQTRGSRRRSAWRSPPPPRWTPPPTACWPSS